MVSFIVGLICGVLTFLLLREKRKNRKEVERLNHEIERLQLEVGAAATERKYTSIKAGFAEPSNSLSLKIPIAAVKDINAGTDIIFRTTFCEFKFNGKTVDNPLCFKDGDDIYPVQFVRMGAYHD